jgi:2,4-dienoyl-CoA reductase-like NADH-dependent reductase (Old Yellow Enzyme family)
VLAKVNLRDGHRGGLEIADSVQLARSLEALGTSALVLSGGFVSRDAFYLFRGERPLRAMIAVEKHWPQKLALALFGPLVIRAHPFAPMYFLPLAREVRRAVRMPLVLLGGITALEHLHVARREGFELMAMARALIHDPDLIKRYQSGVARESGCVPCNRCVAEMDRAGGVRCARVPEQLRERAAALQRGAEPPIDP